MPSLVQTLAVALGHMAIPRSTSDEADQMKALVKKMMPAAGLSHHPESGIKRPSFLGRSVTLKDWGEFTALGNETPIPLPTLFVERWGELCRALRLAPSSPHSLAAGLSTLAL